MAVAIWQVLRPGPGGTEDSEETTQALNRRYGGSATNARQTAHPGPAHAAGPHGRRRRLSVNITPAERAGRIIIGLGAIIAGAVLLASMGSVLAVVLEALLIVAGLDLAITGGFGHCPLYYKLGYMSASLRRPS